MDRNLIKIFISLNLWIFFTCAINVDCTFGPVPWAVLGSSYTCTVKSSQLSVNDSLITGFTGAHTPATNFNSEVLGFFIYNNCLHIKTVPTNIIEYFPNIIAISIYGCGVEVLNGSELSAYIKLQAFFITNNKIERIPSNLFSQNSQIKVVKFDGNKIKRIGANLLEPHQAYLADVTFANNECINMTGTTAPQIASIINHIKIHCVDMQENGDAQMTSEEIIYDLKSKNEKLRSENDELKKKLKSLEMELKAKSEVNESE